LRRTTAAWPLRFDFLEECFDFSYLSRAQVALYNACVHAGLDGGDFRICELGLSFQLLLQAGYYIRALGSFLLCP
jgi:hypothetical protein